MKKEVCVKFELILRKIRMKQNYVGNNQIRHKKSAQIS